MFDVNKNENFGKVSHAVPSQADIPLLANACLVLQVEKQMGSKGTRGKTTAKEGSVSATMAATIKAEDRTLLDLCRGSKIANARLPHKVPVFLIFLPNSQMSGQFTTLAMQSLSKAYWKHIAVAKRQAEVATEQIGLRSAVSGTIVSADKLTT